MFSTNVFSFNDSNLSPILCLYTDIDTNVQRRSDLHVVTSDCDFKFFKNLQKADYWDEPYRKHRLLTHVQWWPWTCFFNAQLYQYM